MRGCSSVASVHMGSEKQEEKVSLVNFPFFPVDSRREANDLKHKKERCCHVHLCGYQHGRREGQRDGTGHSVR